MSMPSWARKNCPGQPPISSEAVRRITQSASQKTATSPPAPLPSERSRWTKHRGVGLPPGSVPRGWTTTTPGSIAATMRFSTSR